MKYRSGEPNGTKMKRYNCKTKSDGNPFHDLESEMWALEIPHSFTPLIGMVSTTTERIQSSFVVRLNTVTTTEQNSLQPASWWITH